MSSALHNVHYCANLIYCFTCVQRKFRRHRLSCSTYSPTVKLDSFPYQTASYGHLEQKDVPAKTNSD